MFVRNSTDFSSTKESYKLETHLRRIDLMEDLHLLPRCSGCVCPPPLPMASRSSLLLSVVDRLHNESAFCMV